ncbi:MAG: gamma-glutamylcyclotransferase family protein [candidate division FCPU426 bacterium]
MPRGDIRITYYLQYGTAVTDRTFDRRIDTARLEGQGKLKGWRMDFSRSGGQPNLVEDPSAFVWGLLYLIEEGKLPLLDKSENGGVRKQVEVFFEGEPQKAWVHVYPASSDKPGAEYLKTLREAYRQGGLPQKQIDQALGVPASAAR